MVRISNDWLKQANSKNYHHFFPKAFLRRKGYSDWLTPCASFSRLEGVRWSSLHQLIPLG